VRRVTDETWYQRTHAADGDMLVAYFCAEFGLAASVPIYSGGLGILAGDHLKTAADLGIPLVAVGLFYREGYFRQDVGDAGQAERYPRNHPEQIGAAPALAPDGTPVEVSVDLAGTAVAARVWRLDVGSVPLYLLDTDVEANPPEFRAVTARLYGGDRENRIRQELVLGVGGVRALRALGLAPTVFHLNEGHSVFLQLERIRELMAAGTPRQAAMERVRRSSVFTTHTPVPAGNEVFDDDLARRHLRDAATALGLTPAQMMAMGKVDGEPGFGLTPLALRTCARANGVSRLHGEVSREMWRGLFPSARADEVPIGYVTNGVHVPTWLGGGLSGLLRAAGARPGDPFDEAFGRAADIPDEELWLVHRDRVAHLVEVANARGAVAGATPRLDPDALTIGFSRRFATYKRAGLLFRDPRRLAALLGDPRRPVQVVLAGKAHPADRDGKGVLRLVTRFAADPAMAGRIVFVPDYDMEVGAAIMQGSDVWLNTPLRPMEASGTSGMKAALNGALNLSILDGWWAEGYDPSAGWAIGDDSEADGDAARDEADHESLFTLLEREVVPAFYERDAGGLPRRWLGMMRSSIARTGEAFSAARMLRQYADELYVPAHRDGRSA
jgi:starch phosphorylase